MALTGRQLGTPLTATLFQCGVICLLLNAALVRAQGLQVVYDQFDPPVLRSDRTQPVLFHVKVSGAPTRVVFEYNTNANPFQQPGTDIEMRDDGSGSDAVAGDGIYTLTFEASQIVQGLTTDDVFRRFVGFVKLFQGASMTLRLNVMAEIITDEVPRLPITALAPDVQRTSYIVNMVDPGFFGGSGFDLTRPARRFYQVLPDDFDFLNIVSGLSHPQNRFHFAVRNDVQGIGLSLFNNTAAYGSAGKLQGISFFPNTVFFDGAESGYQHELGHQWINFLRVAPLQQGIPHWPLSSLATGIMGWSLPPTNQGGAFPCRLVPEGGGVRLNPASSSAERGFTDLDLYLMGLVGPEQVGEHLVFADQNEARTLQCTGQLYTGAIIRVNIGDIISAVGPRVPDVSSSPKRFKIATVIVTRDGLLSEEAMALYSFFARRAEETRQVAIHQGFGRGLSNPFLLSTGGRASLDASLVAPVVPRITDVSASGKKLTVIGENFDTGAVIRVKGKDQKTSNDAQTPATRLIAKKGAKKIKSGQTAAIQVRNSDGNLSNEFSFTRPD